MIQKSKFLIFMCVMMLVAIPCWLYYAVPQFEKLPQKLAYEVDIFSIDNFYDERIKQYLGEQISKTHFTYEVVDNEGDILEIKNVFDVRQISGKKIFSVERTYGVDRLTGKHVEGHGDKDRSGYLFAPKHLKKQDYVYWHINYDEPASLKFKEEEIIDGLTVYRYVADYHADQTSSLGYLPGVPEERGINLDINLQVWVEPVTGWIVKYEDYTIAYYYDINTGQRLHPWNKFSNKYTDSSVAIQVKNAQAKKIIFIFLNNIIPIALGVLSVIFIFMFFWLSFKSKADKKNKESKSYVTSFPLRNLIFSLFFLLLIGGLLVNRFFFDPVIKQKIVNIGISNWVSSAAFKENIEGFKDTLTQAGYEEGVDIQYSIESPNGNKDQQREIIRSFVEDEVDLIYTLTTPGTLIAKGITKKIPIVFSVVTYPVEANVIASLDKSENNLVGSRNYVPASRQYAVFEKIYPHTKVLGFVHRKGEPNSTIQYNEFKKILADRNITVLDIDAIDLQDMRNKLTASIEEIDSLYAACDTLIGAGGEDIVIEFSKQYQKPSFTCNDDGTQIGSLVGNIANLYDLGKISGEKAVNILQGVDPTWLRTESPRKNYIIVNLETAKQLNLTVPQDVLDMADQIIKQ